MGIFGMWAAGESLETIAKRYGVTRERIRLILVKAALIDSNSADARGWRGRLNE